MKKEINVTNCKRRHHAAASRPSSHRLFTLAGACA
ncbi:hypothetical protein Patl1_24219 [Pistacia atlantica]|uniref:Uncharacterized protein n=1 Tax=Pistacia atlantica TaxID=434234 RepID=A0ACC1A0V4_9ROSI|nr:hypothetical protein Patl1_24219 [Pistacia atlantica]